jgi:hypothetical protein
VHRLGSGPANAGGDPAFTTVWFGDVGTAETLFYDSTLGLFLWTPNLSGSVQLTSEYHHPRDSAG